MENNLLIITCSECGKISNVKAYLTNEMPVCQNCSSKPIDPDKREVHQAFAASMNKLYNIKRQAAE